MTPHEQHARWAAEDAKAAPRRPILRDEYLFPLDALPPLRVPVVTGYIVHRYLSLGRRRMITADDVIDHPSTKGYVGCIGVYVRFCRENLRRRPKVVS